MKLSYNFAILLALISIISTISLTRSQKKKKNFLSTVDECNFIDKKDKCSSKGEKCFPINIRIIHLKMGDLPIFENECLKGNDMIYLPGEHCLYKFLGSYCKRKEGIHSTCVNASEYGDPRRKTFKLGVCLSKKGSLCEKDKECLSGFCDPNKNKCGEKPSNVNRKTLDLKIKDENENKVNYYKPEIKKEFFSDWEYDSIEQIYRTLHKEKGFSSYQASFLILQYMVDGEKILNSEIKEDLHRHLSALKMEHSCDDVENELDMLYGIKVVNTWSNSERLDYLKMINDNFIEGINVSFDGNGKLRDSAGTLGAFLDGIQGDFAELSESVGGVIGTIVRTIALSLAQNKIHNSLYTAYEYSLKNEQNHSKLQEALFLKKNYGTLVEDRGIGILNTSLCQEVKMNYGYEYLSHILKNK